MTDLTTEISVQNAPLTGKHKDFLRDLNQLDRDHLGHQIGVSGSYITSLIYRNSQTVSLSVAIAIDKYSKGKLDFRDMVSERDRIDWDFVADRLIEKIESAA